MATEQRYKRDVNGQRFQMGGINTILPADALPPNKYPFLQNVRSYLQGRITGRATQTAATLTLGAAVHTMRRLNDVSPNGPAKGFALISGAGSSLYCDNAATASGLSGNRIALVPFRPNSSPQPWMYVADKNKMLKVRSDGLTYKMGIAEPQDAPTVGTQTTTVTGNIIVLGTARPWSNVNGLNPSYAYGDNGDGSGSVVISTPIEGSTVNLTATGTVTIGGQAHAAGDAGPSGTSNPGHFVNGSCAILCGAWTDSNGNIIQGTGAGVLSIGQNTNLTVPSGATQLQLGIDGTGGSFSSNTGQFNVSYTVTTSSVATKVSIVGMVTAYYWGDSPHTGPVAAYIWKNATDTGGSGPIRDTGDAAGSTTGNSFRFDDGGATQASPVSWDVLDNTGTVVGTTTLFQPALESQGYQDFNVCVVANLYVPAAGSYTFTMAAKDNVMWGIGNNATWPNSGTIRGAAGQSITVVSKCPLLPSPQITGSNNGATDVSVVVTFPGPGVYPIELDWDYWYHDGRTLSIQCNGVDIAPLAGNVKEAVQYRGRYRSSATGAKSNPSPPSDAQQVPSILNTITLPFSPDPQVDKVDYFRVDSVLDDYTYVGTGPNTNPPTLFTDELLDTDIAANPTLEFDNFEPFPSIDLPRKGVVNVIGGIVQWISGDQFDTRWLPGTIINIGGTAYALYNRPSSTTNLRAIDVADGTNLSYEIAEPLLAAQPVVSMWGNTDNAAFAFAIDPLNPGDLLWCKGNDLDSAPDTNRLNVTSPSEPLINGVIANGIGMVFSTENGWSIYPNFSGAVATVTGTVGQPFSLVRSSVTRGLFVRTAICTDGSGLYFYRSKDGIEVSSGGSKQQSITDSDLYNLFNHEGVVPSSITIAGRTIYPPDDTQPEAQHMACANGYMYYDYQDINNVPRTLVYDIAASGWVWDVYQWPVVTHALEEGPNVNGVILGCQDGTIRTLSGIGVEAATCVVLTGSQNAGDARANKTIGDIFVRAFVAAAPVAVAPYFNQYQSAAAGYSPNALSVQAALQPYIVDFADGFARDVNDIALALSWPAGNGTYLDLWQPDWTELPENTQDRPSDWTDSGSSGPMFVQGLTLEANTFGKAKQIAIQSSDDMALHIPDQSPVTFTGQQKQTLTFTPPFVAYSVRIVSMDGVPWRYWGASWSARPFPPLVVQWQTEKTSLDGEGWQHIRELNIAYISTTDLTLTLTFDPGAYPQSMVLKVPSSSGSQAKTKITALGPNKFKLVDFRLSSSTPFRVFEPDCECKIGAWGRQGGYRDVKVIGGESAGGATI